MLGDLGRLIDADAATLALLALILFLLVILAVVALFVILAWKYSDAIDTRIRGNRASTTGESQRSLISREWVSEMGKLSTTVGDHGKRLDRHEERITNLSGGFLGLREKTEALRNDVTGLNKTVEGLCERVDEMRRESREDIRGVHERLDELIRGRA